MDYFDTNNYDINLSDQDYSEPMDFEDEDIDKESSENCCVCGKPIYDCDSGYPDTFYRSFFGEDEGVGEEAAHQRCAIEDEWEEALEYLKLKAGELHG